GLHPADYGGHTAGGAGQQAFAEDRPADCSGVQTAKSKLRNGRPGEITTKRTTNNQTSGHVEAALEITARPAVACRARVSQRLWSFCAMIAEAEKTNGRTTVRPLGDIKIATRSSHAVRFLLLGFLLCHNPTPWV